MPYPSRHHFAANRKAHLESIACHTVGAACLVKDCLAGSNERLVTRTDSVLVRKYGMINNT